MDARHNLTRQVLSVTDYVKSLGIVLPADLAANINAIKTEAYYEHALNRAVLDFHRGDMDSGEFIEEMVQLIEGQFTRAWNEGMRNNDLDPEKDMTDEWEGLLQEAIDNELNNVLNFAQDIENARMAGEPVGPLQQRISLWTNRYNEMVNYAMRTTRPDDRFIWRLGATEEHCDTCAALDGVIATGRDWDASGYHPQGAPNPLLECGGWRCDCRLEYTENPNVTEGGIPL